MKIHSASAFPWQCFCQGWQDFILRALVFTLATSTKILMRSKLVRLLSLLHISQRIRSIMCTIIVVQILLHKYCYMQCSVLFSHVKNCFENNFRCFIFEFKSKDKYERKMLNRLKRNFERKIYMNNFCLMSQVLFFFGAGRWADGKTMKQKLFKKCDVTEFYWYDDIRYESKNCSIAMWTERKRMNKLSKIYNWSDFL